MSKCLSYFILGEYPVNHLQANKPVEENKWAKKSGWINIVVSSSWTFYELYIVNFGWQDCKPKGELLICDVESMSINDFVYDLDKVSMCMSVIIV